MDQVADSRIIKPGRNCWRIEMAERFALIVDAESYFPALKRAILQARHSVYLIGWDFDTRIKFEPTGSTLDGPNRLGRFLTWMVQTRPDLHIYLLKWDLGLLTSFGRGTMPLRLLDWMTDSRIRFQLDGAHPTAAAHHHKIVVIDDVLAFCGGIDITARRWDTPRHLDDDPRRRTPAGRPHGPWHDATSAIAGPVAQALGELARQRWQRATGETLQAPPPRDPLWPEGLPTTLTNVDISISRTVGQYEDESEIREVETLYLDAIGQARRTIYCESQYFASRRVAEAMAARLREPDGPEIVVVNPLSADGFLEPIAMDTARSRLLRLVQAADHHDRFRIFTPVTEGGQPIYVHAKIMVVDDRLFKVGSSNFNNRSLGYDTECDVAIEADDVSPDAGHIREAIVGIRSLLLAEHLGITPENLDAHVAEHDGALVPAIDSLRGSGRTLVPYKPKQNTEIESHIAENELFDPERPPNVWRGLLRLVGLRKRRFQ
ncbi:phospholipase D-like domain-containing protein [Consotaella aegiceratis]|uniref:phospholipase D-like domain-containing protein n=1 Tax=Consotaella aegiceratis TaxID=3097961 RepID=UPI002F41A865